jgi:hypothetical protein
MLKDTNLLASQKWPSIHLMLIELQVANFSFNLMVIAELVDLMARLLVKLLE